MKSKVRGIWEHAESNNRKGLRVLQERGTPVSCRDGCVACCHQWVGVLPLEADEILREVAAKGLDINLVELRRQADYAHTPGLTRAKWFERKMPCVFLRNGSCSIYNARPLQCRAVMVVSDPKECGKPDGVVQKVDNRKPVQRAFQAMVTEHEQSARAPVVLPLPLAIQMRLENRSATELAKRGVYNIPSHETAKVSADGERVERGAV